MAPLRLNFPKYDQEVAQQQGIKVTVLEEYHGKTSLTRYPKAVSRSLNSTGVTATKRVWPLVSFGIRYHHKRPRSFSLISRDFCQLTSFTLHFSQAFTDSNSPAKQVS